MRIFTLQRELSLPFPVQEVWNFFSDPQNLKLITPPEMNFRVLNHDLPTKIYSGMLISYSVTPLFGIRMNWLTEIKQVNDYHYFIDEQKAGPYSLWYHEHWFYETGNSTVMKDKVTYALPFLGNLFNSVIVSKRLKYIFDFRERAVENIFSENNILEK